MKALVTGGAGFIGSHLSERLLDQGAERRRARLLHGFLSAPDQGAEPLRPASAGPATALSKATSADVDLAALLDGVTHVFHLAAQAGVRRSWGAEFEIYTQLNVDSTQRLLEACVGRNIERLVYASSSSVYGDDVAIPMTEQALPQPVSPYGVTKLAAEQLCYLYHVNFGVPTVSLRYFTVYGPRQRPDMGFHRFFSAILDGPAARSSLATACRPAISRMWPTRRPPRPRPQSAECPGASTILEGAPASPCGRSST